MYLYMHFEVCIYIPFFVHVYVCELFYGQNMSWNIVLGSMSECMWHCFGRYVRVNVTFKRIAHKKTGTNPPFNSKEIPKKLKRCWCGCWYRYWYYCWDTDDFSTAEKQKHTKKCTPSLSTTKYIRQTDGWTDTPSDAHVEQRICSLHSFIPSKYKLYSGNSL